MNATIKIETIDVKAASKMLEKLFHAQRSLRKHYVVRLAKEMTDDRFKLSQDAIVIVNDTLANGQHRLQAVVETGISQPFLVLRTNDPEIYKVLDNGMRRSVGDIMGIPYATAMSAIASLTLLYDQKLLFLYSRKAASRGAIVEFIEKHRESLERSATEAHSLLCKQRLCAVSVMGTFLELGGRFDWEQTIAFATEVIRGEGKSSACKLLRERLIKDRMSAASFPSSYVLALIIKTFNAYYEARELKSLRIVDGEPYPEMPV